VAAVLEEPGEDRPVREGSRVALGHTSAGRYLRVIYVPDPEPNSVFVITAYELKGGCWRPILGVEGRNTNETEQVPERVG